MKLLFTVFILISLFISSIVLADSSNNPAWLAKRMKELGLPISTATKWKEMVGPSNVRCTFWATGSKSCSFSWQDEDSRRYFEARLAGGDDLDRFLGMLELAGVRMPAPVNNTSDSVVLENFYCYKVSDFEGMDWKCSITQKFDLR